MALITDPDDLSQGAVTALTDLVFASASGSQITLTSAGSQFPTITAGMYFEIRDHSDPENNGLYQEVGGSPAAGSITAKKITGSNPVNNAVGEAANFLGNSTALANQKSVHYDTNTRFLYLLEQGNLSTDGCTLQALYSFTKEEWKDDADLIPHPFPFVAITPEQFEFQNDWEPTDANAVVTAVAIAAAGDGGTGYTVSDTLTIVGGVGTAATLTVDTVSTGVITGISVATGGSYTTLPGTLDATGIQIDTVTVTGGTGNDDAEFDITIDPLIQTRKLIRTGGWREIDNNSVLKKEYAGIITLGTFEDNANDRAYYQTGTDATDTTSTTDFTFTGPVNEAILTYNDIVPADGGTGVTFTDGGGGSDSIVRNDGGSFVTDGFVVGGQVIVQNANTTANNGTYVIEAVTASTLTIPTASITADTGDNTATMALSYRNAIKLFLRIRDGDPNGKTYQSGDLLSIGVSETTNQVFRFPLSNATDLKIAETDANIAANSPYTQIAIRYFDQAFTQDIDTPGTGRNFGIVIDVGTHSGVDGVSAGTTTFTTAEAGITGANYTGGTLILHDATAPDKGTHTISGTPAAGSVTLTAALTNSETNLSFTLQRSTPIVATAEEIYEKVQYDLRQAVDIDATDQTVTGKTADALLRFVGDTLEAGQATPTNPNGGGSGVNIQGFSSNDTNRLTFYDNTGTGYQFPFVAAGTIAFNNNLVNDTGPAKYWMFFTYTQRTTTATADVVSPSGSTYQLTGDAATLPVLAVDDYIQISGFAQDANNGLFRVTIVNTSQSDYTVTKVDGTAVGTGETNQTVNVDQNPINSPQAIIVDNNSDIDITGTIGGSSVSFDFDYDGNTQGGRTAANDAAVTIRAIGLDSAQFVETTGTITRATGLSFSLVAALERNYENAV